MGFLYLAIRIPRAITISFLFNIFRHARFVFILALTHLGIYKPPPEQHSNAGDNSENYILILEGSSPSLVPIPVHVVTEAIKNRVPIFQFQDFILRHRQEEEEEEMMELCELQVCTICLECIEWSHEIRELCNCSHLFHRECLDTWIDEGQVNCPLCRSMLLPPKTNLTRCNENRDGLPRNHARLVAT